MASLTVNHDQNSPLGLAEGTDDDLGLGFNLAGFRTYVAEMVGDEKFLVTDDFVGEPIPANADAAAALLGRLEAKGGDFVDMFKGPVVYRVLKDEGIDWATESAGGGQLFHMVSKYMNGYDGLAVRRARVWVQAGSSGSLGGGRVSRRPARHRRPLARPPCGK